ncbi:MAG: hypothetical protein IPM16_20335 [Chloroflexi bacterium]|nr:hypothetical protein [Chloroflexota bacterium]
MFKRSRVLSLFVGLAAMLGVFGLVAAQDAPPMVDPLNLTSEPVVLEFSSGPAGPPTIEIVTDGRMTFRIDTAGPVSGSFDGTMTGTVSEMTANPSPAYHQVTVMFKIETELGSFHGYYAGSFHRPEGADQAEIAAVGKILSVSGAYADLYMADVYVNSAVSYADGRSTGEAGTMLIAPR